MKHTFLITVHFLIAATSCIAMETNSKKPDILMELTTIKEPRRAIYLTEDLAAVFNGKKCTIVNTTTNAKIKTIWDNPSPCYSAGIEVHPHKTKIAIFYHSDRHPEIAIYDTQTYAKERSKKIQEASISTASFNPCDTTIITCASHSTYMNLYNYKTDEIIGYDIENQNENLHDMSDTTAKFHPTDPLICIARNNVYIVDTRTRARTEKFHLHTPHAWPYYKHVLPVYSPDGFYIAIHTGNNVFITDSYSNKLDHLTEDFNHTSLSEPLLFHPNSSVLAIVTLKNNLQYWDVGKKELIHETALESDKNGYKLSYLSFSPSGTKLMFTRCGKCIILPVPFKVLFECDTKEQLLYLLFLLKNIDHNRTERLPQDIIEFLMNKLFEALKR